MDAKPFLTFVAEGKDESLPLTHVLRARQGVSRSMMRRLRRDGVVKVNGRSVGLDHVLRAGERVALYLPGDKPSRVKPEPLDLKIVFEDDHLLVLDKPAGLLVHPSGPVLHGTLAGGVAHYLSHKGEPQTAGPVTRLDRNTSGLILFAKYAHAHYRCDQALRRGALHRTYTALVEGLVLEREGSINAPIGRVPGELSRRTVSADGQPAVTHYRVLQTWDELPDVGRATLLEINLETGRTHQIRVHLAHIGHPLVGDPMYGRAHSMLQRQALHASRLEFIHPLQGNELVFESDLPADISRLLSSVRKGR